MINYGPTWGAVATVVTAVAALARWFSSRNDAHFSRRKDVLDRWQEPAAMDDFKLELLVRQITGVYLPACIIRKICSQPEWPTISSLFTLAEMWPLLTWDPYSATLSWTEAANSSRKRTFKNSLFWCFYFLAGTVGGVLVVFSLRPVIAGALPEIAVPMWGAVLIAAAAVSLWRQERWGFAARLGDSYLQRLNAVFNEGVVGHEGGSSATSVEARQ